MGTRGRWWLGTSAAMRWPAARNTREKTPVSRIQQLADPPRLSTSAFQREIRLAAHHQVREARLQLRPPPESPVQSRARYAPSHRRPLGSGRSRRLPDGHVHLNASLQQHLAVRVQITSHRGLPRVHCTRPSPGPPAGRAVVIQCTWRTPWACRKPCRGEPGRSGTRTDCRRFGLPPTADTPSVRSRSPSAIRTTPRGSAVRLHAPRPNEQPLDQLPAAAGRPGWRSTAERQARRTSLASESTGATANSLLGRKLLRGSLRRRNHQPVARGRHAREFRRAPSP